MSSKHATSMTAALAVAGFLLAGVVEAQSSGQMPPPAKPRAQAAQAAAPAQGAAPQPAVPQGPPPPAMGRGAGMGMGRQLNLTDAQKEQLRAMRDQQERDALALRQRMRDARLKLRTAMKADVPDEAAVKAAAGAVAAVQVDQFALQARRKAQLMKVLTPEQQQQVRQFRARAERQAARQMRMNGRGAMQQRQLGPRQLMRRQSMRQQLQRQLLRQLLRQGPPRPIRRQRDIIS
jgi:periplasmic protein CpxP/Spy